MNSHTEKPRSRFIVLIHAVFENISKTIKRFPVAIIFSIALGILLVYSNHNKPSEVLTRVEMTLGLGIALFAFTALLTEKLKGATARKIIINIISLGLLILYGIFLTQKQAVYFDGLRFFRLTGLICASVLLFLSVRHLPYKEGFELYIVRIFVRALVTLIFTGVICGGLDSIIFAADKLFNLNIDRRIYFDMVILVFTLFTPMYFFAGIPSDNELQYEEQKHYPAFIRILVMYIIIPLLLIYLAIVALYCIKVLVEAQPWPSNLIARLIFSAAPIAAASLFLILPLYKTIKWARTALRILPVIILPMFVMMFTALIMRISEYGVTEKRYFTFVMGIWAVYAMLLFCRRFLFPDNQKNTRGFNSVYLPLSLAFVVFLMVLGPVNAYKISRNSQEARFVNISKKYDLITEGKFDEGKISDNTVITDSDKNEIAGILSYFSSKYTLDDMSVLSSLSKKDDIYNMLDIYGNKPGEYQPGKTSWFSYNINKTNKYSFGEIDIKDYELILYNNSYFSGNLNEKANTKDVPETGYTVRFFIDGEARIYKDAVVIMSFDLKNHVNDLIGNNQNPTKGDYIPFESLIYTAGSSALDIMLVITDISGQYERNGQTGNLGTLMLDRISCQVLVNEK